MALPGRVAGMGAVSPEETEALVAGEPHAAKEKGLWGFVIGTWLFMVFSGFCALVAARYLRPDIWDFDSMVGGFLSAATPSL